MGLNADLFYPYSEKINQKQNEFIKSKLENYSIKLKSLRTDFRNPISLKIRYYVDNKQFMREDVEENDIEFNSNIKNELIEDFIQNYDLIILSDYQKGILSPDSIKDIINLCNKKNIPLFIDTKIKNPSFLENAFCIKINLIEYNKLFEKNKLKSNYSIDEIKENINSVRYQYYIKNLIVTMGSKGSFFSSAKESFSLKPRKVDIVDITGAGDAYLSALVFSFCKRNNKSKFSLDNEFIEKEDLKIANYAASSVISKIGTQPIQKEFLDCYEKNKKERIVGFTNGCFDLLHLGHLSLFKEAKRNCDYLIVGLNSDSSIKRLKGKSRPINNQETRYQILKSILYVDEVIIFNEDTPIKLIEQISPDLLIKGSDYLEEEIVGADFVKNKGGKIMRVNLIPNKSTSNIIKKLKNN